MKKLAGFLKGYFKKNSWFKISLYFLFYVLVILMLIPDSRKVISSTLIRYTLIRPKIIPSSVANGINDSDYNWIIEDMNGEKINFNSFKGDIVLVNFWATWCPPCRAEMPSLEKLYTSFGKKIKMIFITDEKRQNVVNFMDKFNYDLPVYFMNSKIPPVFNVSSIPTTFIISRDGKLLVAKKGAANWNADIFREKLRELTD